MGELFVHGVVTGDHPANFHDSPVEIACHRVFFRMNNDGRRKVLQHRDILTANALGDPELAGSVMLSHVLASRYTAMEPGETPWAAADLTTMETDSVAPARRTGVR